MSSILGWVFFISFIIVTAYLFLKHRSKFTPPEVVIGKRKYFDTLNKMYINVFDFDGKNVYYKFDLEGASPKRMHKDDFLRFYRKAPVKNIFRNDDIIP